MHPNLSDIISENNHHDNIDKLNIDFLSDDIDTDTTFNMHHNSNPSNNNQNYVNLHKYHNMEKANCVKYTESYKINDDDNDEYKKSTKALKKQRNINASVDDRWILSEQDILPRETRRCAEDDLEKDLQELYDDEEEEEEEEEDDARRLGRSKGNSADDRDVVVDDSY